MNINKNKELLILSLFILLVRTVVSSRRYKINCIEAEEKVSKKNVYPYYIEDIKSWCATDGHVCTQEGRKERIIKKCRQLFKNFNDNLAWFEVVHCDCEEFNNATLESKNRKDCIQVQQLWFNNKCYPKPVNTNKFWCYKNSIHEKAKEIFNYTLDDLTFFDYIRPQKYRYNQNNYITLSNPDSSFGKGKFINRFGERHRWVLKCTGENELNVSMEYFANKEEPYFKPGPYNKLDQTRIFNRIKKREEISKIWMKDKHVLRNIFPYIGCLETECFKTKFLSVDDVQKISINRYRRLFLFSNITYNIHTGNLNHTIESFLPSGDNNILKITNKFLATFEFTFTFDVQISWVVNKEFYWDTGLQVNCDKIFVKDTIYRSYYLEKESYMNILPQNEDRLLSIVKQHICKSFVRVVTKWYPNNVPNSRYCNGECRWDPWFKD